MLDLFKDFESSETALQDLINKGLFLNTSYPAHFHKDGKGIVVEIDHGRLYYAPYFFDQSLSDETLDYFLACEDIDWKTHDWQTEPDINSLKFKHIDWHHDTIQMFGKKHKLPRISA